MSGTYQTWPPNMSGGAGGAGVSSIGSMDAQASSANGASVSGSSLFMQSASSATAGAGVGLVNTVAQPFLGVKTFVSQPIISALAGASPVFTNATGQLLSGSVSLTTQVVNNLPLAQTSGSISLTAQVSGVLPLANTSVIPVQPGAQTSGSISLTQQVSGNLPLSQTSGSISLTNQVSGNLPVSQTSGSVSLTTQVSGVLPLANMSVVPLQSGSGATSGSVSLTNQVVGNLPLSQTSGSVSLTNQVSGNLPLSQTSGNLPLSQTSGSISLTNQVSGNLPVSQTSGSVTFSQTQYGVATALANYSVGSADGFVICSSASFSIFVPTAAGQVSRCIHFQHNGNSLTQAYTFNTVGSQTIGGVSGNAAYALQTNGELLSIYSDGSNWQIETHRTDTGFTSYSCTVTAFGSISTFNFLWRRTGDCVLINGYLTAGVTAASLASFGLPGTTAIDTTKFNRGNTAGTSASSSGQIIGNYAANSSGNNGFLLSATGTDATKVYFSNGVTNASGTTFPANGSAIVVSNNLVSLATTMIPIVGWQP